MKTMKLEDWNLGNWESHKLENWKIWKLETEKLGTAKLQQSFKLDT